MNDNLKSRISQSFKSKKLHMFGVFLVLAFIFLVLTKFSKTYTERITLDLEYNNLPEDVAITLKEPKTLSVEVNTVGFRILAYYFKNRTIDLNMIDDVELEDSTYLYTPTINDRRIKDRIGNEVEILSVRPDSIYIPYSLLSTKRVPIEIDADITLSSGFDYTDSLKVEPDSVNIIGPESILKQISSISTELLVLSDVENSVRQKINLIQPEFDKIKLSSTSSELIIDIAKFTEGTVEVPITVENLPKNLKINYFPKAVTVSFYVNLKDYGKIKAEDFEVTCNYNQVKNSNKSFFLPTLTSKPDLVRSAKIKQEKIEFITTK